MHKIYMSEVQKRVVTRIYHLADASFYLVLKPERVQRVLNSPEKDREKWGESKTRGHGLTTTAMKTKT